MKLYRVSQTDNYDYDTYSDFVVCCRDEKTARNTNPSTGKPMEESDWKRKYSDWCKSPTLVTVTLIGTATKETKEGIICSSYHAG